MSAPSRLSIVVGGSRPGRLSRKPQSIATIRTGVGPSLIYASIRRLPNPYAGPPIGGYSGDSGNLPRNHQFLFYSADCSACPRPRRTVGLAPDTARGSAPIAALFELDLGAHLLEGGLDLVGLFLVDAF